MTISFNIQTGILLNKREDQFVASFSNQMNKYTGGYFKGTTSLIAARPGMGVYRFLCTEAIHFAKQKLKVLFASSTRNTKVLHLHLLASLLKIDLLKVCELANNQTPESRLKEVKALVDNHPITLFHGRLQEVPSGEFENHDILIIGGFSKNFDYYMPFELSRIKSQYPLTVIMGCWLTRGVETRGGDCRPRIMDIPNSLEGVSDNLCLIYRPEYYGIIEDENGVNTHNMIEFHIIKNLLGNSKMFKLLYNKGIISDE